MIKALLKYKLWSTVAHMAVGYLSKKSTRKAAGKVVKGLMNRAVGMLESGAKAKRRIKRA